jgi:hypothetical protein
MGSGGGKDPLENVVESGMIVLAGRGAESSPDIATMSGRVSFKVVKPQ